MVLSQFLELLRAHVVGEVDRGLGVSLSSSSMAILSPRSRMPYTTRRPLHASQSPHQHRYLYNPIHSILPIYTLFPLPP